MSHGRDVLAYLSVFTVIMALSIPFYRPEAKTQWPPLFHCPRAAGVVYSRQTPKRGDDMDILYQDNSILVCIKPAGVLSTDEPGGVPEPVRTRAFGSPSACRTSAGPPPGSSVDSTPAGLMHTRMLLS